MPPVSLLSAGSNARGQLATGGTEDAHIFTPCRFLDCFPGTLPQGTRRIAHIACGANHTLLLLQRAQDPSSSSTLELWGCGDGSKGQLGLNIPSSTQVFRPLDLVLDRLGLHGYECRLVGACWETSYVVLRSPTGDEDVLLSFGADDFGDLGIGGAKAKGKQVDIPVHVVNLHSHCADALNHGKVHIESLAAGSHHVVIGLTITSPDETVRRYLVGWGTSRHGQLGEWRDERTGRPVPYLSSPKLVSAQRAERVSAVGAGMHHTVLLEPDGCLTALGSNRKGQLSNLHDLRDVVDIGCTWNGTYVLIKTEVTWLVLSTGNYSKGQLGREVQTDATGTPVPTPVDFPCSAGSCTLEKLTCGSEHVLCLLQAATELHQPPQTEVWGWGWNEHGNLGIGTISDQHTPIKIWPAFIEENGQPPAIDIWSGCGTSWIVLGTC